MWMTNWSPTLVAGSPVESINMPELSIVTWPLGSRSRLKIRPGCAGIVRWTSMRSGVAEAAVGSSVMVVLCHRTRDRRPGPKPGDHGVRESDDETTTQLSQCVGPQGGAGGDTGGHVRLRRRHLDQPVRGVCPLRG